MPLSPNDLNHSRQSNSQSLLPGKTKWPVYSRQALFGSQLTYIPIYIIWLTKQDKMTPLFVNLSHPIGPTYE